MFTMIQAALTFKNLIRTAWFGRVAYLLIKRNMDESNGDKYSKQAWNATKYLIFVELIWRISYLVQSYYGR